MATTRDTTVDAATAVAAAEAVLRKQGTAPSCTRQAQGRRPPRSAQSADTCARPATWCSTPRSSRCW